jgi:Rhodanese-like domain
MGRMLTFPAVLSTEKETYSMRKLAVVLAIGIAGAAFGQMKPAQPNPIQITAGTPQQATLTPQVEPSLDQAKRISREDAIKLVKEKKAIWVDVRPKEAFDSGHIKDAYNLPLGEIVTRFKELPPGKEIITYCA